MPTSASKLNATQLAELKTDLAANTNTVLINGVATAINAVPHGADNAQAIADWYNLLCTIDFFGNYSTVPINDVKNEISFKNYTPADAVPASGATTQVTNDLMNWIGRALFCQGYQISVNNLLTAGTVIDATKPNIVGAWKDATNTNMPSGVGGASQKGGWLNIQPILCRKATNIEKLFANTTNGNGADNTHAATLTWEGPISGTDVIAAWAA